MDFELYTLPVPISAAVLYIAFYNEFFLFLTYRFNPSPNGLYLHVQCIQEKFAPSCLEVLFWHILAEGEENVEHAFPLLFIWNMGHHPAGIFLQPEVIADIFIQASELLGNILSLLTDRQLHPKALYQCKDWQIMLSNDTSSLNCIVLTV